MTGSAAQAIKPVQPSRFANHDNVALADAMGDLDAEIAALEARREDARKEMVRRRAVSLEGSRFIVVKTVTETWRFDSKAVRAEMGDEWYDARKAPGKRTTFTAAPRQSAPETPADARAAAEALFRPQA